ncbi:MAG: hypothetical protein N2Z62_09535 [Rhodobacteraceae bacterium]|nr:hypothetical protein [Paracoccaceae bacterium]
MGRRFLRHNIPGTRRPRGDRVLRPLLIRPRGRREGDGFCAPNDHLGLMRVVPEPERMPMRSGNPLYRSRFPGTCDEQLARSEARETDPLKRGTRSPIDRASPVTRDDGTEAKEAIFVCTVTADAPWASVRSQDRKRARLDCMLPDLDSLDRPGRDRRVVHPPDPLGVGQAGHAIHRSEQVLDTSPHPETRRAHPA